MDIKFGTDGWRGEMAREFTFDNVRRVAQAVAEYVKGLPGKASRVPLVVGWDRRFQSDDFAREITRILTANGLKAVMSSEPVPTPAVSLMTRGGKSIGVMVTASHNPPSFNGIKLKMDGRAASEAVTAEVESCLDRANPSRNGAQVAVKSYKKDYLDYLRSRCQPGKFMGAIKRPVVVDYMYGASAGLLGELVKSKKLIEIHAERDPLFGGLHPEPIEQYLGELKERVLKEKALIGIALDGDGDRVALVDDKGRYLSPCQVFPMLLEYLITMRGIKGKIVQSVSLGYLSKRVAKRYELPFEEMPVGFKHVSEAVASGQAALAGEESGGYCWKGGLPERDGLVTGLLALEMCVKTKKTPAQLWELVEKEYGKSFFKRVDYRVTKALEKPVFTAKVRKRLPKKVAGTPIKEVLELDGVKVILEDDHWVLMRPSGTEPLVRTYAESDSPERTQALLDVAARWVNAHL